MKRFALKMISLVKTMINLNTTVNLYFVIAVTQENILRLLCSHEESSLQRHGPASSCTTPAVSSALGFSGREDGSGKCSRPLR